MQWIKHKINNLLEQYGTNEPTELADYLGIAIIYEYLGNNNGLYINQNGCKFIVVNKNLDYYDQRVIIAHELGHAVLHSNLNMAYLENNTYYSRDKFEYQANYFVANLLLPDGFEKDVDFEGMSINQISGLVGMPIELVNIKLYF
ncbi:ImmA/IrrE family metallo-endopeptidase [Vallitalea guaymasensis]|uniref:ImmA/IrrE family metallo-endopeptidase n=1 Tax=Vallitalea guaymasensis TaxID=1185412 RepID=A0A8J8SB68_9FIRM|nr:ImmA/IrrE family metallo-endopeptidase [Vallitalea guaymasensis]QUH28299.1 ImmA/IrrE family metallo-endopeptidase [Vallitalea guaymasensis]